VSRPPPSLPEQKPSQGRRKLPLWSLGRGRYTWCVSARKKGRIRRCGSLDRRAAWPSCAAVTLLCARSVLDELQLLESCYVIALVSEHIDDCPSRALLGSIHQPLSSCSLFIQAWRCLPRPPQVEHWYFAGSAKMVSRLSATDEQPTITWRAQQGYQYAESVQFVCDQRTPYGEGMRRNRDGVKSRLRFQ
jgi:hypothetical protein